MNNAGSALCAMQKITRLTGWRLHHLRFPVQWVVRRAPRNRVLLHPECHDRVHRQRIPVSKTASSLKEAFEGLELCEGKLSCTVLRGLDGSNPVRLTRSLVAPRTDPDGRSLAHPVLIADDWRRSERQERDGALAVEESIAEPTRGCASKRSGVFWLRRRIVRHQSASTRSRKTPPRLARFPGTRVVVEVALHDRLEPSSGFGARDRACAGGVAA